MPRYQYNGVPKPQQRTTIWETGEPRNQCKAITNKNTRCTMFIDPPATYCRAHELVHGWLDEILHGTVK